MSIRVYFDPEKIVQHPEFRSGSLMPDPKTPESWMRGRITIRGLQVLWDFDSHGLPYVNLEGMLNGQLCPRILNIFSAMDFLAQAGYKFSVMKESWEGTSIADQEMKFSKREGLCEYVATAFVKRDMQRTYLELLTLLLPDSCLLFYRFIRSFSGAQSPYYRTCFPYQK